MPTLSDMPKTLTPPGNPTIWRHGNLVAKGFLNPKHDLVYIENQQSDHGYFVVLSVQDMAEIIVAHQRRMRHNLIAGGISS